MTEDIQMNDEPTTDGSDGDEAADAVVAEAEEIVAEAAAPVGAGLANEWTGAPAEPTPPVADAVIDEDELLADDEEEIEPYVSPYDRPGRWFVLHTQSGYEKKVKQNLEARIASMNMEERIYEVVIPTREIPEFKNGKKVMTEKKLFPGYLLCRTSLDDDAWYVIRNTPGVTGFVNQGGTPSPMRRKDVENFLGVEADRAQEATKKSKPMFEYDMGETVRVKEGPFADFSGEIIEINEDQLRVKVLVNIFGRETPVELEFAQVARL
jgi:transcription termination/antitermination protein NusG